MTIPFYTESDIAGAHEATYRIFNFATGTVQSDPPKSYLHPRAAQHHVKEHAKNDHCEYILDADYLFTFFQKTIQEETYIYPVAINSEGRMYHLTDPISGETLRYNNRLRAILESGPLMQAQYPHHAIHYSKYHDWPPVLIATKKSTISNSKKFFGNLFRA